MTTDLTIDMPWTRPPLRANDRRSWQAQARAFEQAKSEAQWAVKAARLPKLTIVEATLHYQPTSARRQDADGIAPSLKACLDAVVAEGILEDDDSRHVTRASCVIHQPAKPGRVWLELVEVKAGEVA